LHCCWQPGWTCRPASAQLRIDGQVQAGGGALTNSTVTLWAASAGEPRQLAQTTAPTFATRFGGNGTVVIFGLAKPIHTPLIGPPKQP
jgi:hypothetical protein